MCVYFRRSLNFIIAMISHFHHFLEGRGLFYSEIILAGSIHFSELNSSPLPRKLFLLITVVISLQLLGRGGQ